LSNAAANKLARSIARMDAVIEEDEKSDDELYFDVKDGSHPMDLNNNGF
jgi:hypothetical protein